MKKVKLKYNIIEGVDGLALTEEEIQKKIDPNHQFPRQFNKGELGCYLSHYSVYKKIVDEQIPYALILEDDINISPRLPDLLKLIEPQIVQGEVISFFGIFPELCYLEKEKNINQTYYFTKPAGGQMVNGGQAYIMTFNAAKNMVNNMLPMNIVLDDWRYWYNKNFISDFKLVFPHPVDVTDTYSEINEPEGGIGLKIKKTIVNYNLPILSNLILKRRRKSRFHFNINNIFIDGQKPKILFY